MATMKVENGELRIDVESLIGSLPEAERTKIAKLIGADGEAWREMAEAVADPDDFFTGDEDAAPWYLDHRKMLEVREKLLPLMPDVAKHAVAELRRQLDESNNQQRRFHDWAWAMWHAHQDWEHNPVQWPKLPDWAPAARDEMRVRDAAPGMKAALAKLEARILEAGKSTPWGGDVSTTLDRVESLAIETSILRECVAALRSAGAED